jgi:D-aminopeptidase
VLDVAGVGVGHATVHRDEPAPPEGRGTARTGVSCLVLAEDAYRRPVPAGGAVLNGAGEVTGFLALREWGALESPVYLTSTMQTGRVYDAACALEIEADGQVADEVVIPVVAECDDSFLNDCRRMQVTADDVRSARDAAYASRGSGSPPDEGAVGAGTGMSCFEFKGGIGTASRVTGTGHTVGVLLLTNFGTRDQAVVAGVPVGRELGAAPGAGPRTPAGSCIGVVVTDAPVDSHGCERLARRVGLGLARTGSVAHHGSGEIFLGFGTGLRLDRGIAPEAGSPALVAGAGLDPLFAAVVEATEEAVLNSMFTAPTVVGRDGNTSPSLHSPEVLALLAGVRS